MIRRALDEVIDTPRTGRLTLEEIEKTEKTYIGTKVEILFRNMINFPKGLFDLDIDGVDVDIKNTVGSNWTLPPEVFNRPCILISSDEKKAVCSLGLVVVRPQYLSAGTNRDQKKTISKANFKYIRWILKDFLYQKNFWRDVDKTQVERIFKYSGGTDRVLQLFKEMRNAPIPRNVIEGIAQQKDPMKRLRKNGGARDKMASQGMVLLSGAYDSKLIKQLGLPFCSRDEFIPYKVRNEEEKKLLKKHLS